MFMVKRVGFKKLKPTLFLRPFVWSKNPLFYSKKVFVICLYSSVYSF